jgi:sphinganine-1-phosphate aldolase
LSTLVRVVPGAQQLLDQQLETEVDGAMENMFNTEGLSEQLNSIPEIGMHQKELLTKMQGWKDSNRVEKGKLFAYVYDSDVDTIWETVQAAHNIFMVDNALNPVAFPTLRYLENEVVGMAISMLHGPPEACGVMSTGGTESILLAVKTYRDRARAIWPHITEPEIVLPATGHPAFFKAAHYLGLTAIAVPIDPITMLPRMDQYAKSISHKTILLVGSAPAYPHGVMDPLEEIAILAEKHNLPMHVDACIGGFLLPWVEKLGYPVPAWDFRLPAVTSISADVHKYGYAAKGASLIIYANPSLRKHQFFAYTSWPGGLFLSPSVLGTRGGGSIAGAYAAMCALGQDGYTRLADRIMKTRDALVAGINAIDGLQVLGAPVMSIISFASTEAAIDILAVADVMESKYGWSMERQQCPPSLHFSLMPSHGKFVEDLLQNLAASVQAIRDDPSLTSQGTAAMYGMVAKIPDGSIVESFLTQLTHKLYSRPALE